MRIILFSAILLIITNSLCPAADTIESQKKTGSIHISSTPPEAEISIDERPTGFKTPALISNIDAGIHTIDLALPEYLFFSKYVIILPDSTLTVSFNLISPIDTAHIQGKNTGIGVLILPKAPIEKPYLIDRKPNGSGEISLSQGKHRVRWDGGILYASLDTLIEVFSGGIKSVDFKFKRLTGSFSVFPFPIDANVFLDSLNQTFGELSGTIPTGEYNVKVSRRGYYPVEKKIVVLPGREIYTNIDLVKIPDSDGDGYLDSKDLCPDKYGLYGGCPKAPKRESLRLLMKNLWGSMRSDQLAFSVNAVGYSYRKATNPNFRRFLSYFNDGNRFLNNLDGFVALNTYGVSYNGFIISVELGQWNSGLCYLKNDTLTISTANENYDIFYDTLLQSEPIVYLPSTAISIGFNFCTNNLCLSYTFGRQLEDIVIIDLNRRSDNAKINVVFNNDFWFHKLHMSIMFDIGEKVFPEIYTVFSIPAGSSMRTGWIGLHSGIKFRFMPFYKVNGKSVSNKKG